MYHQVRVLPEETDFLRFVWRDPGSSSPPDTYQMLVHVFGTICSSSTCFYAHQKTAKDNRAKYPDVVERIFRNFYVDYYLDSVDSEDEAVNLCSQLSTVEAKGGFRLTKWQSSSRKVLSSIAVSERCHPGLDLD